MKNEDKDNKNTKIKETLMPYIQAMPYIFNYQIVTKILLAVWLFLLGKIFQILLRSSGRVAVTSGDYTFLFTTWQGILILLVGIISLFIYVAFDLNTKIVLSRDLVTGQISPLVESIKEGFFSIRRLLCPRGLFIVLYIALIAPILGIGLSITATEKLYIPTFIATFIQDSVLYSALAGVAAVALLIQGIAHLYILHGIVIDDLSAKEAGSQSRKLIKANWKDYLKKNILYIITIGILLAVVAILFLFLPLKLITLLPAGPVSRILTILFVTLGTVISVSADLFGLPLYILKMTQLFYSYKQGTECKYAELPGKKPGHYKIITIGVLVAVVIAVGAMYVYFDQLFPPDTNVKVIAHRAGGIEGPENTVVGIEVACTAGAYGSEIDIQRTKDGYYVINHDGNFKRVAGVNRKPEEMTLKEVKKLSVSGEPVPTFEEMLEASKGRLVLFVELKGNTADIKMAEDAVRIIKQYQMEEECVLISLKYDLIDYIETKYPEMQTGFLTFASFGKTASLNCDYIGLEEESATTDAVSSIHHEGKKAMVWTANEKGSQKHFLCSNVDGLITDNITQAIIISKQLMERSDLDRMVDKIKTLL